MEDNISKVYSKLVSGIGYQGTEDDFRNYIAVDENIPKVYNKLVSGIGYKGTEDDFRGYIGKPRQQQPGTAPRVYVSDVERSAENGSTVAEASSIPTVTMEQLDQQQVKYPFPSYYPQYRNDDANPSVDQKVKDDGFVVPSELTEENFKSVKQRRDELNKRLEEIGKSAQHLGQMGFMAPKEPLNALSEEAKKIRSELETIDGFIDSWNNTDEANAYLERQKQRVNDVSLSIDKAQEENNRNIINRQIERESKLTSFGRLAKDLRAVKNPITPEIVETFTDPTTNGLRAAKNEVRNADKQLQLEEMRRNGEMKGLAFIRGLETANYYELIPAIGMADAFAILDAKQALEEGRELNQSQQLLLEAMEARAEVDYAYQDNNTIWERVGRSTPEQLMFTAQFVVGAGVTGATKVGERVAAKSAERAAAKYAKKGVKSSARRFIGGNVLPKLEGMAVSSAMQTFANPLGVAGMVEDFERRYAGDIYYDNEGNLHVFDNDRGAGKAAYQAIASAWIENFTEYAGENITKSAKLLDSKMFDIAGKFDNVIKRVGAGKIADVFSIPKQLGQITQIGSAPEEILEEELGSVMNALFATDAESGESYGDSFKRTIGQSFSGEQQLETLLSCAITSMLLGGGGNAVNAVGNAGRRKQANRDVEESKALLGKVRGINIDELDIQIENGEIKDIASYLKQQSDANGWSQDEQGAAVSYVMNRTRQIGMRHFDDTAIAEAQQEMRRKAEDMANRWDGNIYNATWKDGDGNEQPVTIVNGRVHYNTSDDGTIRFDPYTSSAMFAIRLADGTPKQVPSRTITGIQAVNSIDDQLQSQGQTIPQIMQAQFEQEGMAIPTIESVWGGNLVANETQFEDGKYTYLGQDENGRYAFANNDKRTNKDNPIVHKTERQLIEYGLSLNIQAANAAGDAETARQAQDDLDFMQHLDEITADATEKEQWDVVKSYAKQKVAFDENGEMDADNSNVRAAAAYLLALSEGSFENAISSIDESVAALAAQQVQQQQSTDISTDAAANAEASAAAGSVDASVSAKVDFYHSVRNSLLEMRDGQQDAKEEAKAEEQRKAEEYRASHPEKGDNISIIYNGNETAAEVIDIDTEGRYVVIVYDSEQNPIESGLEITQDEYDKMREQINTPAEETNEEEQPVTETQGRSIDFDDNIQIGELGENQMDAIWDTIGDIEYKCHVTIKEKNVKRDGNYFRIEIEVKKKDDLNNLRNYCDKFGFDFGYIRTRGLFKSSHYSVNITVPISYEDKYEEGKTTYYTPKHIPISVGDKITYEYGTCVIESFDEHLGKAFANARFEDGEKGEVTFDLKHIDNDIYYGRIKNIERAGTSDGNGIEQQPSSDVNQEESVAEQPQGTTEEAVQPTEPQAEQSAEQPTTQPSDTSTGQQNEETPISPAQQTYESLVQKYGDKAGHKVDVTSDDKNKTLDKAKKALEKAQTDYDDAPIGKEEKAEKALQKAKEEYDKALSDKQQWDEVKSVKDRFVARQLAERQAADDERYANALAEEEARKAENARKKAEQEQLGANNVSDNIREKWNNSTKIEGNADEITLANGERIEGHYYLVESGSASASHDATEGFKKTEGFPVDENGQTVNDRDYEGDMNAQQITRTMAQNYDSRAAQEAPVVSQDGIVMSGNGRTMAGELAALNNTDGAYIEYLNKYPHKYGFTTEQVGGMSHPRVVFVPNERMPYTTDTFAKFNQQGMKGQSKTEQAVKLGKIVDDATFGRIIRSINRFDTLGDFYADSNATAEAIGELQKAGAINQMQHTEMFDGETISETGKQMLENMLIGKAFESNPDAVRQLAAYKSLRQSVITALAEISNNIALGEYSLESELSQAIELAYNARSKGYKAGDKVSEFAGQTVLFAEDGATAADFTNATVMMLADLLNDNRVTRLKKALQVYNNQAVQSAAGQMDLFSGDVKTKEQILDEVLLLLQNGTEQEQQEALDKAREQRKADAGREESVQQDGDAGESNQGERVSEPQQPEPTEEISDEEVESVISSMKEHAVTVPFVEITDNNWRNSVVTPIGEVKMGENQKEKLFAKGREQQYGMLLETLGNPDIILEELDKEENIFHERPSSYLFVKTFQKEDGTKYVHFESVTVSQEGMEISVSSHIIRENQLRNKVKSDRLLYKATALDEPAHPSAGQPTNEGVSLSSDGKDTQNSETQAENAENSGKNVTDNGYTITPSKYTTKKGKVLDMQLVKFDNELGKEQQRAANSLARDLKGWWSRDDGGFLMRDEATAHQLIDAVLEESGETLQEAAPLSLSDMRGETEQTKLTDEAVAAANEEVDTKPTEAQKEAGNYKKGHVKIDGFDISIENPAGSTRSGTDAQGNPWKVTMHNSYGYIRMTEGVDGDHIDIFLSDHIDDWNGTVYVVDQVNEDGSFDEHKVMYGFNSAEEAREAYLSNYSEGWQGLGTITGVSREEFRKWVDSSHRKTKAFADYKSVQTTEGQNEAAAPVSEENNGTDGTNRTDNQAEETVTEQPKESREELDKRLMEERKQRILAEGTSFDKPFGLVPVSETMTVEDIDTNMQRIAEGLKANEGNKDFGNFYGFAYQGNFKENAGQQLKGYYQSLTGVVDPKTLMAWTGSHGFKTYNDVVEYGKGLYDKTDRTKGTEKAEKTDKTETEPKKQPKAPSKAGSQKIDDVGEKIAGARKDMRREIAKGIGEATVQSLIELPFSKAFKKPNLKKAVESGALREEDAFFFDAWLASTVNTTKPKVTQQEVRRKKYNPNAETNLERWAKQTFEALDFLKTFVEADETERDRIIGNLTAEVFPKREAQLAEFERIRELNKGRNDNITFGDCLTPNPVWVTCQVMQRLGYAVGDKLDIPFGILRGNTTGTSYYLYNTKDEHSTYIYPNSLEEGIDAIVWLAKIKRGDTDIQHPVSAFYTTPTKSEMGDSGRFRVIWGGWSSMKNQEFDSKEEAEAFAAKKKDAYVNPIQEVKRRFGYKIMFRNPLTGERTAVIDMEFDTKAEAEAYMDGNYEAINDGANEMLAKESGTKREVTADDVVGVTVTYGKDGWQYAAVINAPYANNMGMPLVLQEFKTRGEAKAYADNVKDKVFETYKQYKAKQKEFVYFSQGEDTRIGEDYRGGKDVSAEDFMNTFGFRGVQFGNWTNQADRQMAVNQAYDAFMDLSKLIGMSPKAMSLNGELGIAFGARGSGNANAHYEYDEVVINLTKTRGAGSLAHEWWHALDNYFARRGGMGRGMVTDVKSIAMRDELRKAYDRLIDEIEKSNYYKRSVKKGDYWGRMHEVTARLLAEWVNRELKQKGELNTFLARGVDTEKFVKMNYELYKMLMDNAGREAMPFEEYKELDEALSGMPYPSDKEIDAFSDALRNIFETIEEREEDGKTVLFLIDKEDWNERVIAGQDLKDEANSYGHHPSFNFDYTVNLVHGTSQENAEKILKEGLQKGSFLAQSEEESKQHVDAKRKDNVFLTIKVDARDISYNGATNEYYAENGLVMDADGVWVSPQRKEANEKELERRKQTDEKQLAYNAVREALANAGIDVVEATEEDVKRLKDSRKQLKDSKGTIRGWVGNDGKIHLTKDGLNAETPIHEYTHLWAEALQMNNPDLWEQIKGLLKGTPEWQRITSMKEYSNLNDDDRIAGEVLAHISGKKNAERMEAEAKRMIDEAPTLEEAAKAANLLGRMRDALKKFWTWVGKTLLGRKGSINIDQVSNMVMADLANGVNPFNPGGRKRKGTSASVDEDTDIESVNRKFNDELDSLTTDNADSKVLDCGMPSAILMSVGVPAKKLRLYGNKVIKKARKHGFSITDIKDLPLSLQRPIAVFNGNHEDSFAVLTEMKINGLNTLVSIETNKEGEIDFNVISSVYGKNEKSVIGWINDGNLLYADKEKALGYISDSAPIAEAQYNQGPLSESVKKNLDFASPSAPIADATQNQDFISAAKVIENFVNPQVEGENFSDVDLSIAVPDSGRMAVRDEFDEISGAHPTEKAKTIRQKYEQLLTDQVNKFRPLKQLEEILSEKKGRKLRDSESFYSRATMTAARTLPQMEAEREIYLLPLEQAVNEVFGILDPDGKRAGRRTRQEEGGRENKTMKLLRQRIADYLIAKHGLERNKWFHQQALAKDPNAQEEDKSGLRGLAESLGENPDDYKAVAERVVAEFEQEVGQQGIDNLWKEINGFTNRLLEMSYKDGFTDKDHYEELKGRWKHYVPLRGFAEGTSDDMYYYITQGGDSAVTMMKAKGRTSKADDPLTHLVRMQEKAVTAGNDNWAKIALYNAAINLPSDLLRVKRVWYTEDHNTGEIIEHCADLTGLTSPDDIDAAIKQFNADMKAAGAKRRLNKADVGKRIRPQNLGEHEIEVWVNGKKEIIEVNGNPSLVRAYSESQDELKGFIKGVQKANRLEARLFTTWNPEFAVKNMMRDTNFALFSAFVIGGTKQWNETRKNIHTARLVLPKLMKDGTVSQTLVKDAADRQKLEQWYREFIENGGETGFTRTMNAEQVSRDINDTLLAMAKGNEDGVTKMEKLAGAIEDLNRWAENSTRFAAYITARERGETVTKAMDAAKNSTLNFNIKGYEGKRLRAWFCFFNARLQGVAQLARLAKENPKRFAIGLGAAVLTGAMVPFLNILLLGLGGDDDDWNTYEYMSEYTGNNNLVLFVPGIHKFVAIPYSQELAPFSAIGNIWFREAMGWNRNKSAWQQELEMGLAYLPMEINLSDKEGTWPMLGSTVARSVSPTIMQPIVEYAVNENFMNMPLRKDSKYKSELAAWTQAYENRTSGALIKASKWLNGGGSENRWGKAEVLIDPSFIQHVVEGTAGGVGSFIGNARDLFTEPDWFNHLPFVRKFMFDGDPKKWQGGLDRAYSAYAYDFIDERDRRIDAIRYDNQSTLDYARQMWAEHNSTDKAIYDLAKDYRDNLGKYKKKVDGHWVNMSSFGENRYRYKDNGRDLLPIIGLKGMRQYYNDLRANDAEQEEIDEWRGKISEYEMQMVEEIEAVYYRDHIQGKKPVTEGLRKMVDDARGIEEGPIGQP